MKAINPSVRVIFVAMDLQSPSSVQKAAQEINSNPEIPKIDVLINCAGIMVCPYKATEWKAPDGSPLEAQLGTNHMGHFLLTTLLLDKIQKAAPGARIVNVASSGHRFGGMRFEDPGFKVCVLLSLCQVIVPDYFGEERRNVQCLGRIWPIQDGNDLDDELFSGNNSCLRHCFILPEPWQ
jgi:NAD(P)-dependent dehydrogenase (short-subunit alcohol dehydrogenase family)